MTESVPPVADLSSAGDWVLVARLGRTRGLRGEIYGDVLADEARVLALEQVWLRSSEGSWANEGEPLEVAEVRPYKGKVVFRFAGVRRIEDAQPFERCEVLTPRALRPALEDGEFYMTDLVGCEVWDRATGVKLGVVTGWQEFGGPEVLEVKPEGVEGQSKDEVFWVPFARSICVEIDPAAKRIVVDPPEGLLALNREPVRAEGTKRRETA